MALDVDLLRSSFALVIERAPDLTARFYDVLFVRYPQSKPLFGRNARAAQENMLAQALAAVIDHVEDATWLSQTLGGLGAKHLDYGVTPEMYDWVGDSLLVTLAEIAGPIWSPELEAAWTDAYNAIRTLMLAGAEEAERRNREVPIAS
jgi:hemoglobin-like flavoprotein